MKKYKFENVEFNVTEEVFDYSNLIAEGFMHEPESYKYGLSVLETFDDNDVFIDVGGCLGLFSLLMTKGTSFCFEPSVENWALCKRNFELNPEKNIILFNDAVGDRHVPYYVERLTHINEGNNGTALPGQTKTEFGEGDKYTVVLDECVLPQLKPNQKVKLIKTDTEGHDREVLAGAIKIIEKFHPTIITENIAPDWISEIGYTFIGKLNDLNYIWIYDKDGTN